MTDTAYRSIYRPGVFAGQTVIVTGGGSGIGRCIAHELASLGAALALVGRKVEKLQAVQAEIATAAPTAKVTIHSCDIRDEPGVRQMVADVLAAHGRIGGRGLHHRLVHPRRRRGVPNARQTWKLEEGSRNQPYEGFPLATMPQCLEPGAQ